MNGVFLYIYLGPTFWQESSFVIIIYIHFIITIIRDMIYFYCGKIQA